MEAVVKSKRGSSLALRTGSPVSRCDEEDNGESGSTEDRRRVDGDGDRPASSTGWKATESRLCCWKSLSRTWTARRSAGSPLGKLSYFVRRESPLHGKGRVKRGDRICFLMWFLTDVRN